MVPVYLALSGPRDISLSVFKLGKSQANQDELVTLRPC